MNCPTCNSPLRETQGRLVTGTPIALYECQKCKQAFQRPTPIVQPALQFSESEPSEHDIQCALFAKIRRYERDYPELQWIYAVPNGGFRHISVAKAMHAEGTRAGVPDICVPMARRGYHGLYIEMKTPKGVVRPRQKEWHAMLEREGYRIVVYRSADEAWNEILWYLNLRVMSLRRAA